MQYPRLPQPGVIFVKAESTGIELPWRQRRKGSDIIDIHVSIRRVYLLMIACILNKASLEVQIGLDGAMRTHGTRDGHYNSHYPTGSLFRNCQRVPGHRAATTCGNGLESFSMACQSGVAIVNLRFLISDFLVVLVYHRF